MGGIALHHKAPKDVLLWHSENGFPGVSEAIMNKIFTDRKLDPPLYAEAGCDFETTLALGLMRAINPTMDDVDARDALQNRLGSDEPCVHSETLTGMPESMVDDCVKVADKQFLRDHVKATQKSKPNTWWHAQK